MAESVEITLVQVSGTAVVLRKGSGVVGSGELNGCFSKENLGFASRVTVHPREVWITGDATIGSKWAAEVDNVEHRRRDWKRQHISSHSCESSASLLSK